MSKRVYAVRVTKATVAMVLADSEVDAIAIAEHDATEILRECPQDVDADTVGVIQSQAELAQHGWDEMCLPYGGDGNTRLSEILPA